MNMPALFELVATLCTALFAGAAIYINVAEHPARMECGTAIAVAEFGPSYRRAAKMQASLAAVGTLAAILAWWQGQDTIVLVAGVLLGFVIPFTLLVIRPTNNRLLDTSRDLSANETDTLLRRWGWLHMVRSVASGIALLLLLLA